VTLKNALTIPDLTVYPILLGQLQDSGNFDLGRILATLRHAHGKHDEGQKNEQPNGGGLEAVHGLSPKRSVIRSADPR
jgi:hypothetical protein